MRWQPRTPWRYAGAHSSMSHCPPPMSQVIIKTPAQLDL
ncbi:type I methionyl aminopeptidase, partial [Enterobacter mori]